MVWPGNLGACIGIEGITLDAHWMSERDDQGEITELVKGAPLNQHTIGLRCTRHRARAGRFSKSGAAFIYTCALICVFAMRAGRASPVARGWVRCVMNVA